MSSMFEGSAFNNGGAALDWDDGFGVNANLTKCLEIQLSFNQNISMTHQMFKNDFDV